MDLKLMLAAWLTGWPGQAAGKTAADELSAEKVSGRHGRSFVQSVRDFVA